MRLWLALPLAPTPHPEQERATVRLGALLEGEGGPDSLGFAQQLNAPHLLPVRRLLPPHALAPTPDP